MTRPRNVFLDANVLIRAGKPPGGPLVSRIIDLTDAGYIKVITTDLTKIEVAKKHANNEFDDAVVLTKSRVRRLASDLLGVSIPETSSGDLHRKILEKYSAAVEDMLRSMSAETISIDNVKPSAVFDSYLHKTGVFGDGAKKDQFPDAFILEALKSIATAASPLIVVSEDGDFAAAARGTPNLSHVKSIADLFALLNFTVEAAPEVEEFFENHLDDIIGRADIELGGWGLQVSDVDDAEIETTTVENVTFLGFRTFRVVGEGRDILVVGRMSMSVRVSYHHPDWDTATYDSEDKVLLPHHTVEGEKSIDVDADFSMTLKVGPDGKPHAIAELSFDDDEFIWVSIGYDPYDDK